MIDIPPTQSDRAGDLPRGVPCAAVNHMQTDSDSVLDLAVKGRGRVFESLVPPHYKLSLYIVGTPSISDLAMPREAPIPIWARIVPNAHENLRAASHVNQA